MPPGGAVVRRIAFGDVAVEFLSEDSSWIAQLSRRYSGFETEAPPSFSTRYDVVESVTPIALPALGEVCATEGHRGEPSRLSGPGFEVSFDLAAREAVIAGPPHTYPVDALMRELLPVLATDGVVMHAALACDGGRAWICTGPAGCGKSTLTALLGERALCDELALVRVRRDAIEACALPYWNAHAGCAPLAGICLLRHGKVHRRSRRSPEAASRSLFDEVLWPARFPDRLARTLALFGDLVERVPVFELEFAPTPDVAAVLFDEVSP